MTTVEAEQLRSVLYEAFERFGRRPTDGDAPSESGLQRFHFSVAVVPLDE